MNPLRFFSYDWWFSRSSERTNGLVGRNSVKVNIKSTQINYTHNKHSNLPQTETVCRCSFEGQQRDNGMRAMRDLNDACLTKCTGVMCSWLCRVPTFVTSIQPLQWRLWEAWLALAMWSGGYEKQAGRRHIPWYCCGTCICTTTSVKVSSPSCDQSWRRNSSTRRDRHVTSASSDRDGRRWR